jgi:hypothetical protein
MMKPTTNTDAAVSLDMATRFPVKAPVGDETVSSHRLGALAM